MKKILLFLTVLLCAVSAHAEFAWGNAPFVNNWAVLGVFQNMGGLDDDLIGEKTIAPKIGDQTAGMTWEYFDDRLFSRNYDDYADLYSYFRVKKNIELTSYTAYLHVYVYSPKEQSVQLRYGADRFSKVFLNGEEVARHEVGRTEFPENCKNFDHPCSFYWYVLYDVTAKDIYIIDATLKEGWNSVLIKMGTGRAGNLGAYFRVCDADGNKVPGVEYSVNGDKVPLSIDNDKLSVETESNMPVAYREWPYVVFKQSPEFEKFASQIGYSIRYTSAAQASPFVFTASGGQLPYTWTLKGDLPKGIKFKNGEFTGTVAENASLGEYNFTVTVKDKAGATDTKDYKIILKERPNKWVEQGRLTALIHEPNSYDPSCFEEFASVVKAQGYTLVMPISYNNGTYRFRFDCPKYNIIPEKNTWDVISPLKAAFEKEKVPFGMYTGNVLASPQFAVDQACDFYNEVMSKYNPQAFWMDWAGMDHASTDQMFSLIKTKNPDIIIFMNGFEKATNGDWDILSFEDLNTFSEPENIWGRWPYEDYAQALGYVYNWPKQFSLETWRCITMPNEEHPNKADWDEFMRMTIANNSDGAITNLDHTIGALTDEDAMWRFEAHRKMAKWCNSGSEPLYKGYTNCYPLYDLGGDYGYSNISADGKNIYVIFTVNPKGKKGITKDSLNLKIKNKINDAVCINTGKKVSFTQTNDSVKLNLKDLEQDFIATIVKLSLNEPMAYSDARHEFINYEKPNKKAGNKAFGKRSKLVHPTDGSQMVPSNDISYSFLGNDGVMSSATVAAWSWNYIYEVDLDKVENIKKICVYFAQDKSKDVGYATEFKVLVSSDGKTWETVKEADNPNGERDFVFNLGKTIKARYVRVEAIKPNDAGQKGGQMNIAELEVY